MLRFISLIALLLFTFCLPLHDAQAKRFGGGRSFGMQRNVSGFSRQPFQSIQQAQKPSFASKWLAPLAGFALGGLLATLFMHNGFGSGLLLWLGIGLVILFLINLFRNKMQPASSNAYSGQFAQPSFERDHAASHLRDPSSQTGELQQAYPRDFNSDSFIRDAKAQFIRLQTAYDHKNLNDLREFTTPEVFAEIQLQLHERGNANNETVVVQLNAELLEVLKEPLAHEEDRDRYVASVRFTGKIREELNEEISLDETWHFVKTDNSYRWFVAGIQQH